MRKPFPLFQFYTQHNHANVVWYRKQNNFKIVLHGPSCFEKTRPVAELLSNRAYQILNSIISKVSKFTHYLAHGLEWNILIHLK